MFSRRSMSRRAVVVIAISGLVVAGVVGSASATDAGQSSSQHLSMNCEYSTLCPDVVDSAQVFGSDEYVEATPKNLRLRKKILDEVQRKRSTQTRATKVVAE